MNKETVETAADKYSPDPIYNDGQWEFGDVIEGFKDGATWQKQQEANNAIEFAVWVMKQKFDYLVGKSYTELYELWQKSKNNADN